MKPYKVIELFAGVGGFRLGLQGVKNGIGPCYQIVWSSQWEPATKKQHASDVYVKRFKPNKSEHSNEDISKVATSRIPDHDILVAGFPCQDYSVAKALGKAHGIVGKKGVLWWEIYRIIKNKKKKPQYLILENVDRLLKSPADQRGRDFAIILKSLSLLGYIVEWRVVNAAEYGFPQKRRRVFLVGYHRETSLYRQIKKTDDFLNDWLIKKGILATAFPVKNNKKKPLLITHESIDITGNLEEVSLNFGRGEEALPFLNTGMIIDDQVITLNTSPHLKYQNKKKTLRSVLDAPSLIPKEYFIPNSKLGKWRMAKKSRSIMRKNAKGYHYFYTEGPMQFPDPIDQPSRTIVTGEGGKTPSRFKHIILTDSGKYRRLTPRELEKLNGFPKNFTKFKGIPDSRRAFLMGNALVVGVVKKIGAALYKKILTC